MSGIRVTAFQWVPDFAQGLVRDLRVRWAPPRMHLTRYDGVFAPHSKLGARLLKRVFGIQIEDCARCGGKLKVIASIEEPRVIAKILSHLEKSAPDQFQPELPLGARAPPSQVSLFS